MEYESNSKVSVGTCSRCKGIGILHLWRRYEICLACNGKGTVPICPEKANNNMSTKMSQHGVAIPICPGCGQVKRINKCTICSLCGGPKTMFDEDRRLTIDEDRVREAAKACPDARKVLDILFPGILDQKLDYIPLADSSLPKGTKLYVKSVIDDGVQPYLERRNSGNFINSIYLPISTGWSWETVEDNEGMTVLVCRPKG